MEEWYYIVCEFFTGWFTNLVEGAIKFILLGPEG